MPPELQHRSCRARTSGPARRGRRRVLGGTVVTPERVHHDGVLAMDGDTLAWVGDAAAWEATRPADAGWPAPETLGGHLLPGLVDLHCHGGAGTGFPDGEPDGAVRAARHHLGHGTTGLVASLVTAPEADMVAALADCADLVEAGELVGIHLEGPFLSSAWCGAQDPASLRAPDTALLGRLLEVGRGHVRTLTYAPELPGADRIAAQALAAGVVPSVGHTDADHACVAAAIRRADGRSSVTHLFNAMPALHHRAPGPAAAALAAARRGETILELVADGVHLADETVAMTFDLVGAGQVALVTDAMAAAGQPDGDYRLGRLALSVREGVARLARGPDGSEEPPPLAGGTARLLDVVRRSVQHAGIDLRDAVAAASSTPARLLGLDTLTGSLRAGLRADVLVTDDQLHPVEVLRAGVPAVSTPDPERNLSRNHTSGDPT